MMRRRVASTAITFGSILLILNIVGLFAPITEHAAASQKHKVNLFRPSYEVSLEALGLDKSLPPEQLIAEANRIIAARVVHYWPDPGESDPYTM
jgi:hypothetical protein